MRRAVVTGVGVLSPVGRGKESFFAALTAGRSGVRRLSAPFVEKLAAKLGAELDFDGAEHFPRRKLASLDRVTQISLVAAQDALEDSALILDERQKDRAGVFWGTGMGSAQSLEASYVSRFTVSFLH